MAFKCLICSQYLGSKARYKGSQTCIQCHRDNNKRGRKL